ncbi:IS1595 family transposase [Octadecabacter ascidiaceicola]|uniref:ISXO2-like transposase domain protein n=1 Tax=Octadecabacter ascidiaceicola TaxID=1655543 RepID=A0A238K340_9RHOB|nr:IS1595 family transposase [Octadecabacter ascidiaceicola]SMX36804.1 ISXO2-like transposase domain protein [Octadecabacter ascidiaceicola]
MKQTNVRQFFQQFPTDEACLEHLFNVRFGQGHECPKCERAAKWYPLKSEKAFSCQWCGHHIHPMVGSIFEKSRTPLQLWFYAIFLFTTTRNGVAAKELQRQLGVTYKTAWRMAHLIREHMAGIDGDGMLSGTVEVDETFVGGYEKGAQVGKGKAVVLGMLERDGELVTEVIPDRKGGTLARHVVDHVEFGSVVNTDEHRGYNSLAGAYDHKTVNHSQGQYVGDAGETTNSIEGFFAQLKRTIAGTHIYVSDKHLWKYAKECEYRFNRRMKPESMLAELLSRFPELDA